MYLGLQIKQMKKQIFFKKFKLADCLEEIVFSDNAEISHIRSKLSIHRFWLVYEQ